MLFTPTRLLSIISADSEKREVTIMNNMKLGMVGIVLVLVWASWFFRYAPHEKGLALDRLTGKYVFLEIDLDNPNRKE